MSEHKLGNRIKKFREDQNMTREELADTAGLPLKTIVALEETNAYASIAPLQKVALALGVRLGTFMDDMITRDPLIVRAQQRETDLVMHRTASEKSFYRFYSLGKGKADRNMEPFFVEIEPDEVSLSSHQGEEFIIVVSGVLNVVHGKEEHLLSPGDSIYFNSIVPHFVGAGNNEPCSIFAVMYHP